MLRSPDRKIQWDHLYYVGPCTPYPWSVADGRERFYAAERLFPPEQFAALDLKPLVSVSNSIMKLGAQSQALPLYFQLAFFYTRTSISMSQVSYE